MTTLLSRFTCHYLSAASRSFPFVWLANLSYASDAPALAVSHSSLLIYALLITLLAIFLALKLHKSFNTKKVHQDKYHSLCSTHDELLTQKHHWKEQEASLHQQIETLEKRLTARTETVNKVNHELTQTLEQRQHYAYLFESQRRVLNSSGQVLLIIDKHYRVCFASQAFLNFTGLLLTDIQDKPIRLLEKHICLPEMANNGLALNEDGWLNTQLKCRDDQDRMHVLNARICLTWSAQKEIVHYVIMIEKTEQTKPKAK